LPQLDLRKGDLNQLAYSLYLFVRDECQGDLVWYIDELFRLGTEREASIDEIREQLLKAFGRIHAVSTKLVSMVLSDLLLAVGPRRRKWVELGATMVAIDSLVHNFLHRTGILQAYDAMHPYGQKGFRASGCMGVVRDLAQRFDAETIDPLFPANFPRFVQHAIWSFCAEQRFNVCNGRQIDDRGPCGRIDCVVGDVCSRTAIGPPFGPIKEADPTGVEP
jgi:hypothetical protein